MLMRTTPFAAVAGSATTKTDERYYCRACFCTDHADHIEATGSITCAECDSEDVIPLEAHQRQQQVEWEAAMAEADRDADARYSSLAVLL